MQETWAIKKILAFISKIMEQKSIKREAVVSKMEHLNTKIYVYLYMYIGQKETHMKFL